GDARQLVDLCVGGIHLGDLDAEPRPVHHAVFDQVICDLTGQVDGDGEARAGKVARARLDRGVDADHAPEQVDHRAARVAAVDRGIGLDERLELRVRVVAEDVDVPILRADDAG